ncbi:MAG: OmpA family protein [Pseudobdellovibrio sp.]
MNKMITKGLFAALFLVGCAQKQMAVADNSDIQQTIADDQHKIDQAYEEQWDVLAQDELSKAEKALQSARQHYAARGDLTKAGDDFTNFQLYYTQAQGLADARSPKVQGLLKTRREIIDKGIRRYPDEDKSLGKLDNEFRSLSKKQYVNAQDYSELQNKYIMLGSRGSKKEILGSARFQIDEAKKNKAKKYAPRSLNTAELDLKNAENVIDSNTNQPDSYLSAVRKANRSAAILTAVVTEQRKVDYNLDESEAEKIVEQSGRIDQMNFDLATTNAALNETQANLSEKEEREKAEAEKAETEKHFQDTIAEAQKQFSPSEADVYRQGDKILIRLKSIGFASGKSDIPDKSKDLIERVSKVAEKLDAKQLVIEGHTDSVGSTQANDAISKKRAESVMSYLTSDGWDSSKIQAVGLGSQKPLSSNETKAGRAENRRVDVWITPTEPTKTE